MNNQYISSAIITIGDELLIGQTIDTNSAWIAQETRKIGLRTKLRLAVGDNQKDIVEALDEVKKHADIVFVTGGLGPTSDDKTKQIVAQYFNTHLTLHPETLQKVEQIFKNLKMPLIERNIQQAYLPEKCTIIPNDVGTAPGMWFEKENTIFIFMPGVPSEMKSIMQNSVIPKLSKYYRVQIADRHMTTIGQYESFLAERLDSFEKSLPQEMSLAYLPNAFGFIRLRLTAYNQSIYEIDKYFDELKKILSDCIATTEDKTMIEVIVELLKKNHQTVSTAESCTGGYLAHLFTKISGVSSCYWGSVVSYDTSVKKNILQVKEESILQHNVVSEQVAIEMMQGALHRLHTDYAIGVTGIMGPDGGSEKYPIGMVCVAVGNEQHYISKTFRFRGNRMQNIESTTQHSLNMLRLFILNQK